MDQYEKYFNRVLRFLSYRPRSEKEIRDYLAYRKSRSTRKTPEKVEQKVIEKIIKRLKELNFINDREFTRLFIEQRQGTKPRGWKVIKMELKQKGISEELISNFQFQISNEGELARKAAMKKIDAYQKLPPLEFKQKMGQFLARRGFGWETIKFTIDELLKKE